MKELSNEILAELIGLYENKKSTNLPDNANIDMVIEDQLTLINFCFDNLNIKKLNIELWETIGEKIGNGLTLALTEESSCADAWDALRKIYLVIFNYDMKMANLNSWVADSITKLRQDAAEGGKLVDEIKKFFEEEYRRANNE